MKSLRNSRLPILAKESILLGLENMRDGKGVYERLDDERDLEIINKKIYHLRRSIAFQKRERFGESDNEFLLSLAFGSFD